MGLFSRNTRRNDYPDDQANYNQGVNNNNTYNNNTNVRDTRHGATGINNNDNNYTNTTGFTGGRNTHHNTLGHNNNNANNYNDGSNITNRHGVHNNRDTFGNNNNNTNTLNDGTNRHHGLHNNRNNRNNVGNYDNNNDDYDDYDVDEKRHGDRRGNRLGRRGRHDNRSKKPRMEKRELFDLHSGYYNRRPSFGTWLKYTWLDILTMIAMGAVGLGVYEADPAPSRSFPVTFSDGQVVYPQFAYPLRNEIIPIWAAALLGALVPIFVILCMQIRIKSFWDTNNGIIGLLYSLIGAAVFQVFVKWLIGGLRPHFLSVCQPDMSRVTAGGDGFQSLMFKSDICTGNRKEINDSLESMPSGHSTAAWAGFLYLYFYLNGKLKVFSNYHPAMWKLIALYAPLLGATLITGSLTIDEFHNWYDCLAGAIIGSVFAISSYRMVYASVWDFRFNHIPLTRHTPFSYGAGPAGAAGFESCVFTHAAGWGYEEAFGGAPFDSAFGLRGGGGGMGGFGGRNESSITANENTVGLGHKHTGHRDGDIEHNATTGIGHTHGHHNDHHNRGLGHHNKEHLGHQNKEHLGHHNNDHLGRNTNVGMAHNTTTLGHGNTGHLGHHNNTRLGHNTNDGLGRNTDDGLGRNNNDVPGRNTNDGLGRNTNDNVIRNTNDGLGRNTNDNVIRSNNDGLGRNNNDVLGRNTNDGLGRNTNDNVVRDTNDGLGRNNNTYTGQTTNDGLGRNTNDNMIRNTNDGLGRNTGDSLVHNTQNDGLGRNTTGNTSHHNTTHRIGHNTNDGLGRNNDIYDNTYNDNNTTTGTRFNNNTNTGTGFSNTNTTGTGTGIGTGTGNTLHNTGPTEGEFMREGRSSNIDNNDANRYRSHRKSLERKAITGRNEPAF